MSGDSRKGSTSCGSTPYLINKCHSVEGVRGLREKREKSRGVGGSEWQQYWSWLKCTSKQPHLVHEEIHSITKHGRLRLGNNSHIRLLSRCYTTPNNKLEEVPCVPFISQMLTYCMLLFGNTDLQISCDVCTANEKFKVWEVTSQKGQEMVQTCFFTQEWNNCLKYSHICSVRHYTDFLVKKLIVFNLLLT